MSDEEKIGEVVLPPVKVPEDVKKVIDEFKYLDLKGDKVKLYVTADIMREALIKGLRLMLLERKVFNEMIEREAKEGAKRIYSSLKTGGIKTGGIKS